MTLQSREILVQIVKLIKQTLTLKLCAPSMKLTALYTAFGQGSTVTSI